MRKSWLVRIVAIAFVLTLAFTLVFSLTACSGYDVTKKEGDVTKRTSLEVGDDGKFTVLQFSDLHLTSDGSYKLDRETLRWVEEAIDKAKPDLVELTGDAVGGSKAKRDKAVLALANIFEKKKVYWAYTFGNHDGEHTDVDGKDLWLGRDGKQTLVKDVLKNVSTGELADRLFFGDNTRGNKEIFELLKGYEYSLLARSAEETADEDSETKMGVGNYVIDLKNSKGDTVFALFHMDTHGKTYIEPKGNIKGSDGYIDTGYLGLTDMQVEWYENKVKGYSEKGIKTALFMHVPSYAYREAFEVMKGNNKYGIPQFTEKADIKYWAEKNMISEDIMNIEFVKEEGIYAARWDEGLMDVIAKYPSTALISVGHDHNNSFMTKHKLGAGNEVILGYGRTSGVNAWSRDIEIGASVFTVEFESGAYEGIAVNTVYPSFKYTKYGNR